MSDAQDILEENRVKLFGTTWGEWEVWYGGYDSPADRVPTWARWDNPIDDDGKDVLEAGGGFRLNTPSAGVMSVDRSYPDPQGRTHPVGSVISRRDEYLKPEDGLTLEWSVKIRPPTVTSAENGHAGFVALYRNGAGRVYGMHFEQGSIRGGGYGRYANQGPAKPLNTTVKRKYRMVVHGAGTAHSCYVDGNHVFDAVGNDYQVTSLNANDKYPTIIIGGEKGNRTTSYELDYVGYRRGAFAPGAALPTILRRDPPPLPKPRPSWLEWNDAEIIRYPAHIPRPVLPHEFRSAKPNYNTYTVCLTPPCLDKGDLTIEWTLQVAPDCEWRGFQQMLRDHMGSVGLLWSPDGVEMTMGVKNTGYYKDIPIGILRHSMNTTDRQHTYTLVRPANSFYAYLYIDNSSLPAIYDYHSDSSESGWYDSPPPAIVWGDSMNPWGKGHVHIEQIRWSNSAHAPA